MQNLFLNYDVITHIYDLDGVEHDVDFIYEQSSRKLTPQLASFLHAYRDFM